jgi:WD40 repeat protein
MTASNFFQAVNYHPDESQILTTGTDRKITFWDAYDCQAIRLIDGSLSSEMNCLDITPDGEGFVSGGVDREVKLWNYDEGHCYFVGLGHSGPITKVIDPPFLHPLSPQFVCPKFPQILKGTFLWISLPTTNSILNLDVVLCIH